MDDRSRGLRDDLALSAFPPLFLIVILSIAVALGIILSRGAELRRWPPAAVFVLIAGSLGLSLELNWLCWICALASGVGLILPMALTVFALRLARQGRLRRASRWAGWVSRLNREWSDVSIRWYLVAEYLDGRPERLEVQVADWTARGDEASLARRDAVYMLIGEWEPLQYSSILEYRIRALTELGRHEQAALEFASAWESQRGLRTQRGLRRASLPLLAWTGRVESVRRVLLSVGAAPGVNHYWMYTVLMAGRRFEQANTHRDQVIVHMKDHPLLELRWTQRQGQPAEDADLESPVMEVLDRVEAEIDCAFTLRLEWFWRHPMVMAMCVLIACGFGIQSLRGGVDDPGVALAMGALLAEGQLPAEPWRLIAYGFIHFGWVHLLTNVLVLALVGPIVSRTHGAIFFITCLLGGVLCAGVSISLFGSPGVTVGASGGTMALIGALATYVLTDPLIRVTRWGRTVGLFLCVLATMELALDLLTPSISLAGHLGGLLSGVVLIGVTINGSKTSRG